MSTRVFPSLPTVGFPVRRGISFITKVETSVSDKETRLSYTTRPKYDYELTFEVLRSYQGLTELATLQGFYAQARGAFDSWLYDDPDDNSITGQEMGIGDGVTTSFQMVRSFGGFADPVLAPNFVTSAYINGTPISGIGLTSPAAPTCGSVAGGVLGAFTYKVKVTLSTPNGETPASGETSKAISANNLLTVTSPAVAQNATGYFVYVSTTTNTETRQNATPIPLGTTWTLPTTGYTATGPAYPTGITPFTVNRWGSASSGTLVFSVPPAAGFVVTADFTYYWPCRFTDDRLEHEKFMLGRNSVKSLKFSTIK